MKHTIEFFCWYCGYYNFSYASISGFIKSNYPLLKLNTVGSTEINACQIREDIRHSGQEDTSL